MKKYIVHVNGTRYSISASSARKAVHGVLKSLIGVKTTEKMMPLVILVSYLGGLTMDKQQEQQVKELADLIKKDGAYSAELDAYAVNPATAACRILNDGWRKAGELTVISDEEIKTILDKHYATPLSVKTIKNYWVYKLVLDALKAQRGHDREA